MAGAFVYTTKGFRRAAKKLLGEAEVGRLMRYLSDRPDSGDLIRETGGARKLRWALPGRGKSGGARVIHYYDGRSVVYLVTVYAKNEQADLSADQRKAVAAFVRELKEMES